MCIRATVDLRQCPELSVGTEDKIGTRRRPLHFACLAISSFKHVLRVRGRLPRRSHIEQVNEEVVRQSLWPLSEDAILGLSHVDIQHPQARNKNGQLRRCQREQLCLIQRHDLGWSVAVAVSVRAEAVCGWFKHSEGFHIGLLLRSVHSPRRAGNSYVDASITRSLLDASTTRKNDQVGDRNLLSTLLRAVEVALNLSERLQDLLQ